MVKLLYVIEEALKLVFRDASIVAEKLKQIDLEDKNEMKKLQAKLKTVLEAMPEMDHLPHKLSKEAFNYVSLCIKLGAEIPDPEDMNDLKKKIMELQSADANPNNMPKIDLYYKQAKEFIEQRQLAHKLPMLKVESMEIKPHYGRFIVSCPNSCGNWITVDEYEDSTNKETQKFSPRELESHVFVNCQKLKKTLKRTKTVDAQTQTTPRPFRPVNIKEEVYEISSDEDETPFSFSAKTTAKMDTAKKKANSKLVEFLNDWNSGFPEVQITEKDMQNPSEAFFRSAMILCLKNLNIDTSSFATIDYETGTRLKQLRCRLMAWTNEALATATGDGNLKISYMDLLSPKKAHVRNVLQYLTNYVMFHREVYKRSINGSYEAIREFESLKTQKNALKRSIEASKITRDAQQTISTFKNRTEALKKDLHDIQQTSQKCDYTIHELRSQITTVSANIVPDNEAKSIMESRNELKQQLQEQEEIINSERGRLQGMSQNIEKIHAAVSKMEQIMSTCSIDVSDIKNIKTECDKLEASVAKLKHDIAKNSQEIQAQSQVIDKKKKSTAQLQSQSAAAELTYNETMKADQSVIKKREARLKDFELKESDIYDEQVLVKEEMELMYNISSNIIKQMSESIYE